MENYVDNICYFSSVLTLVLHLHLFVFYVQGELETDIFDTSNEERFFYDYAQALQAQEIPWFIGPIS